MQRRMRVGTATSMGHRASRRPLVEVRSFLIYYAGGDRARQEWLTVTRTEEQRRAGITWEELRPTIADLPGPVRE